MSWWFSFSCFDSNKWIIVHDLIQQNPPHNKINLISISFILPDHTVLNNIISTQILQNKSFKYYLIHYIISDSTQYNLFSLIKNISPRGLDGLKERYWQGIYLSVVWFVDLLITSRSRSLIILQWEEVIIIKGESPDVHAWPGYTSIVPPHKAWTLISLMWIFALRHYFMQVY